MLPPGPAPPLPKPVLQALLSQLRAQVAHTPAFYVSTGIDLGTLHKYPGYPASIGLNNVDSITGLTWYVSVTSAIGSGTLNVNNCKPDCADGSASQYAVRVLLSDAQQCNVKVFDTSSSTFADISTNIFDKASIVSLSGTPPASLVGSSVLNTGHQPVCG